MGQETSKSTLKYEQIHNSHPQTLFLHNPHYFKPDFFPLNLRTENVCLLLSPTYLTSPDGQLYNICKHTDNTKLFITILHLL